MCLKVTIVGAGNMGLAMAGYMALNNKAEVRLFSGKNVLENGALTVNDVEGGVKAATGSFSCESDPSVAFADADVVFVTYPAFLRKNFIDKYGAYLKSGAYLGFVPGYGGAEYFCVDLVKKGINVFGFQRVPYVARASKKEDGTYEAGILSKKNTLYICAIPHAKTPEISGIVENLLDIPVQQLKEYLSITLAPSNPLLHITGLYNVFKNSEPDTKFDSQLSFYAEWNDATSEMLFAYDDELQQICKALAPLDMSEVVPLPVYYESPTPEKMTAKLKSIEPFKAVMVPLRKDEDCYYPDLDSRMFVEDYPFGVCVIKDFALMTGVSVPTVDLLLDFYARISGHRYFDENGAYTSEIMDTGIPGINGLKTVDDIIGFYHK